MTLLSSTAGGNSPLAATPTGTSPPEHAETLASVLACEFDLALLHLSVHVERTTGILLASR